MKKSLALLLALAAILLFVTPVLAGRPFIESFHYDFVDEDVVDCTDYGYDFKIDDAIVYDTRWTYRCDGRDACTPETATEIKIHGSGVDNLFNENHPEQVISSHFAWNLAVADPVTFESTMTGAFWAVTLPGHGSVYFETGRALWDPETGYVPLAGHHEFDPILCEVLNVTD